MRGALKVLALVIGLAIVVGSGGCLILTCVLGHKFYVVDGQATVSADAVRNVQLPALLCSGHGGPLETSAVYGDALRAHYGDPAHVICSVPENASAFEYKESLYYGHTPRDMHVYVWLEHHPELAEMCTSATSAIIDVKPEQLQGFTSQQLRERPCFGPDRHGSLGFTIAFRGIFSGDHETRPIEVKPNGYP